MLRGRFDVNGIRGTLVGKIKGVLAHESGHDRVNSRPGARRFHGCIPDIPAYGEGETEQEAIEDLKEAIRGYIETFGLEDALTRVSSPEIRLVDWDLTELAHG
jgi:hypothetical protein